MHTPEREAQTHRFLYDCGKCIRTLVRTQALLGVVFLPHSLCEAGCGLHGHVAEESQDMISARSRKPTSAKVLLFKNSLR